MDHRQARKTGWTIIGCGCVFIILTKLWVGLAMAALGLLLIALGAGAPRGEDSVLPARQRQPVPQVPRPPVSGPAGVPPGGNLQQRNNRNMARKKSSDQG